MRSFLFAVNCANKTLPAIFADPDTPPPSDYRAAFFIVDGFFFIYIYAFIPFLFRVVRALRYHYPTHARTPTFYYQRFYFIAFTSYEINKKKKPPKKTTTRNNNKHV